MKSGEAVRRFEEAFAEYVGARYAIALCNGTATLHTALHALGVRPGRPRVAVPPLTMASTAIAVLHAGGKPVFCDIDPETWLIDGHSTEALSCAYGVPVSLYGLHVQPWFARQVDDAAQTLRQHQGGNDFTSFSFQASKILPLGEGGMLVTNNEELARRAREFSSLGYRMDADQPRIDPAAIKRPDAVRHHALGWNYRMADAVAEVGLQFLSATLTLAGIAPIDAIRSGRIRAAGWYRDTVAGCPWITPQHVPEGWQHDYWTYAVALESAELWGPFTDAIVRHGGEMPYGAWRLTYQEPAFRHLAEDGCCPVAEDLQPRLVQFQTNNLESAARNAEAASKAIREIGG